MMLWGVSLNSRKEARLQLKAGEGGEGHISRGEADIKKGKIESNERKKEGDRIATILYEGERGKKSPYVGRDWKVRGKAINHYSPGGEKEGRFPILLIQGQSPNLLRKKKSDLLSCSPQSEVSGITSSATELGNRIATALRNKVIKKERKVGEFLRPLHRTGENRS